MKKLLLNNLKWLVLITILSIGFWTFIFDNITKAKDYEKIEIFITSDNIDKDALKELLAHENVKEININNCGENDEYYTATLETLGIISSDILIVTEDLVLTDGATTSFIELDKDYLKEFTINLSDFKLLYIDNKPHAIIVYDKENNINLLADYISFYDEDKVYCLVLNDISHHIGKYSKENETTTVAFEVIYKLLYQTNKGL